MSTAIAEPSRSRMLSAHVFICAATFSILLCLLPKVALAQSQKVPSEAQRWNGVFQAIAQENEPRLMVGDVEGYVAAIRSAIKADDWVSQMIAGNAVYRVSPLAAIAFHEAAAKLAPNEGVPHLELGFDYQRTGQCERAIQAWQTADRLNALNSPSTAVAAYCFFRTGRVDDALGLWARVQWPGQRVALDFAISEMAIGTRALDVHIKAYGLARTGDERAFRTLIGNALDWRKDWWNASVNHKAFDAVRALAKNVRPSDSRLHRELDCANEASLAKDADALRDVLLRCRLLIGDGELPDSSEVAKFLLARLDALKSAPVGDLLNRYGGVLERRAKSSEGDLAALEILAFLQVTARDQTASKATDELGWHRYRVAKFATSRLMGALADKQEWSSHGEALLKDALKDFPETALLHKLRYEMFPPVPSEHERYLVDWLCAEHAGLTGNFPSVGIPTSTTLASVVFTLRKRREEQLKPSI